MPALNFLAIIAAALAAFAFSAVYYSVVVPQPAAEGGAAAAASSAGMWMIPIEVARALVVSVVLAVLIALIPGVNLPGALLLAVALWAAFPVVLLAGSVIHEGVPLSVATAHAGDWLAKLLIIAGVVSVWR